MSVRCLSACSLCKSTWVSCLKVLTPGSTRLNLTVVSTTAAYSLRKLVEIFTGVPNLGQVRFCTMGYVSYSFPFPGHVMVGADLEGIELRALGHYLAVFDEGAFAEVVCNGDIHQQNADRVGCTRSQVKKFLTYGFIYGAGDQLSLAHILHPEYSDAQKKVPSVVTFAVSSLMRFLVFEPLIDAVKLKVRETGKLKGLDKRPIFCDGEHKSLNFLLQSCGAIFEQALVCHCTGPCLMTLVLPMTRTTLAALTCTMNSSSLSSHQKQTVLHDCLVEAAPLAGQYYKFRVPITAASDMGANWAATH